MERIWLKSYPEGVPAEIDPNAFRSLGEFFAASVAKFRDQTAFISMGKAISYGELDEKSRAFGAYLQNVVRLPRGARVALMLPNLLQYPIAMFGALRAGYVVVNCNPLYSPRELGHQLADSGAEAIVVLENFAHTLEKAIGGTAVTTVVVTGAGDQLGGARGRIVNLVVRHIRRAVPAFRLERAERFNRALELGGAQAFTEAPVEPTDVAFLQYTGGTTGVPKGAMLTHRNLIANLQQVHAWVAAAISPEGETFLAALPLYHVFALQANCFVPVMIGASNLLIANPRDIPALVKDFAKDAVHGHHRRQHPLQRAPEQPGFRPARFLAPAPGDRRRHGGAARGRRAVEIADRQAVDRSLRIDRDLARRDRQSADHRGLYRRDRPAAAFDRHRHSRRRRPRPAARRDRRIVHQGPAGDGRLLEHARRDRQGDGRRRLLAHRRHRPGRRARLRVRGRPEEGHDQCLRLQSLSERDRRRADDPSGGARGRRGRRSRLQDRRGGQDRGGAQGQGADRRRSHRPLRGNI